jgi:hypothetical protein
MSGIPPLIDQIDFASSQKEVVVNRVNNAEAPAAVFGIKTLVGLSLVLYGGTIRVGGVPTAVANQTITLADNATNYVKVNSAGVVSSVSTIPGGWPGPISSATALYTIVTASGVATAVSEWRSIGGSTPGGGGGGASMIVVAPAYAASLTVDLSLYAEFPVVVMNVGTLTGPMTFDLTNGADGQIVRARFTQDGTGGRVFTAGAHLRFSVDTPSPVLTTTANKMDRLAFEWHSGAGFADLIAINKTY